MANRLHLTEPLGAHLPDAGFIRHVAACADNTAYAIVAEAQGGMHRVVFGGRIVAEVRHDLLPFSLSFDGAKVATAERLRDGKNRGYEVCINGEFVCATALDTIHHLDWLGNGRLAWDGWNNDREGGIDDAGIRTFVNGEDVTDTLEYEPVLLERMRHALVVRENGMRHVVFDDGSRTEPVAVEPGEEFCQTKERAFADGRREHPETVRDEKTGRQCVRYRGKEGPWFDEVSTNGFGDGLAFDAARTKVAHVGCDYATPARLMGKVARTAFERAEEEEDRNERAPWWAWPFALLFSPYVGPLYAYAESSKRYRPVDGMKPWKRGYRRVNDIFYAPSGALAAVVSGLRGSRLVIDEDEGPVFDEIYNARSGKDGRVTYLARTGNRFTRVTVDG